MIQILKLSWGILAILLAVVLSVFVVDPYMGLVAFLAALAILAYLAWKNMGGYLVMLRKYDHAIYYLTGQINSNPEDARLYDIRGTAHYMKGDAYASLQDYKKALEINPQYVDTHNNLGMVYSKLGDYGAALTSYDNAISLKPQVSYYYSNRGILLLKQHYHKEALEDFNEAIRLAPNLSTPYYLRGNYFFMYEDYPLALKNYQYARGLDSKLLQTEAGTAIALHAMGDLRQAQNTWKSLIKKNIQYNDPNWLRTELQWAEPLIKEARKLIAALDE